MRERPPLQEHNHPQQQLTIFDQQRGSTRRSDPETSHEAAASVTRIRESQRFVKALFRKHGPMTDQQAWEIYKRDYLGRKDYDVPQMTESGMRTRRSEITPPRGKGIRDTGAKLRTTANRRATVWAVDD